MTRVKKIDALLAAITLADIERMPPAERQRLAQALRRIADFADPPPRRTVESIQRKHARQPQVCPGT